MPYIEAQAILAHGQHVVGAQIRGVAPNLERTATGLAQKFTQGAIEQLVPGTYHIVLGSALAAALDAKVGDSLFLLAPQATATPAGLQPRMRRFAVTGIFSSGMYEYDRVLALVEIHDAARVYRMGENVTGLRLAITRSVAGAQRGAPGGAEHPGGRTSMSATGPAAMRISFATSPS